MNFTKSKHYFKSSNGTDQIAYYIYTPKEKAKALIQISHGMCEYVERYEKFIDYLCGLGYAVIANDHLGHGNSVSCDDDLGFFALEHGWIYLIKDLRKTFLIGKSMFGKIPHYFVGHSMGSLILRCYLAKYSTDTDGAIIIGTVGRHPGVPAAILLADAEIALHGVKSRSKKINRLLFGLSNIKVDDKRTEFDWISRDESIVAEYVADKRCNFVFTSSAFKDLFLLLDYCSSRSWYNKVRCDIPILLMGGTDDPIGSFGRGVMQVFRGLNAHGFTDVEVKICDGCRHELLNETNRLEMYDEIAHWLEVRIKRRSCEI